MPLHSFRGLPMLALLGLAVGPVSLAQAEVVGMASGTGSILDQVLRNLGEGQGLTGSDTKFFINFAENKGVTGADGQGLTVVTGAILSGQSGPVAVQGSGQGVPPQTTPLMTGRLSTTVLGSSNTGTIDVAIVPPAGFDPVPGQTDAMPLVPFDVSDIVMLNGASNRVSVDGTVSTNGVLAALGPGAVSASAMGAVNYGAINLGLQGNGTILLPGAAPLSHR
jgi:hypothetical protein